MSHSEGPNRDPNRARHNRYATIEDMADAVSALEKKVPSRWEVRSLILGAIVVSNFNVPTQITTAAVAAGAIGLVGKAVSVLFFRS